MSQFHLFPPTQNVPFTAAPFQSPPNLQQIPLQLQFQLAAWHALRLRQQEQMMNALSGAKAQAQEKLDNEEAIEDVDVLSVEDDSSERDDRKGRGFKKKSVV